MTNMFCKDKIFLYYDLSFLVTPFIFMMESEHLYSNYFVGVVAADDDFV